MRAVLSIVIGLAASARVSSAEPDVDALARDLASPVFATRERAGRELWKLGKGATAALEKVATGDDAEARSRAEAILEKFSWGLYPDTPEKIREQIDIIRGGGVEGQQAAIKALLKLGDAGIAAAHVVMKHDHGDSRFAIGYAMADIINREAPRLIMARQVDRAESLLRLSALSTDDDASLDYATFVIQQKRVAASIPLLEADIRRGGQIGDAATATLALVHQMNGQHTAARNLIDAYSKKFPESQLFESILEEQGAWGDLADVGPRGRDLGNATGLHLFRELRAGRNDRANKIIAELRNGNEGETDLDHQRTAVALLLNGSITEGIEFLKSRKEPSRLMLSDLLAARMEFSAALALLDTPPPVEVKPGRRLILRSTSQYDVRRGRILAQMGNHAEADLAFDAAMKRVATDRTSMRDLLRAEVRANRFAKAAEHAGEFLDAEEKRNRDRDSYYSPFRPTPWEILFEDDAEAAQGWWTVLTSVKPRQPGSTLVPLIRRLLTNTATMDECDDALRTMSDFRRRNTMGMGMTLQVHVRLCRAMAAYARVRHDHSGEERELRSALAAYPPADETSEVMQDLGSTAWAYSTTEDFRPWADLGDLLMKQGRPMNAAAIYHDGWRRYPHHPLPLYLSGRAYLAAGNAAEGELRIKASHEVSFGSSRMRGRFVEELSNRGRRADFVNELHRARAVVWCGSIVGNTWSQLSRAAPLAGEHALAVDAGERYVNYIFNNSGRFSFVDARSYFDLPLQTLVNRVMVAANAGRWDDAIRLADQVVAIAPGHTQLPIHLVPALVAHGRGADAERYYQACRKVYDTLIGSHPHSAWARISRAHLAANCRRDLDSALADAREATALDRDSKWAREVLAEVHFRRGERITATGIMTTLADESPRNYFYQRQLKRFAHGTFDSPQPTGPVE